ncbi:hypothetical protein [Rathayibacter soli]|uniref:hypothetical protein n=1 Tax=Rathayibacter soli TaxID=3144168 RepID=UPI0027E58187|nr:hypothetical protein [Glaciibacter superstes]
MNASRGKSATALHPVGRHPLASPVLASPVLASPVLASPGRVEAGGRLLTSLAAASGRCGRATVPRPAVIVMLIDESKS